MDHVLPLTNETIDSNAVTMIVFSSCILAAVLCVGFHMYRDIDLTYDPVEERRKLVRDCLEFRTIAAAAPAKTKKAARETNLELPSGDTVNEDHNTNTEEDENGECDGVSEKNGEKIRDSSDEEGGGGGIHGDDGDNGIHGEDCKDETNDPNAEIDNANKRIQERKNDDKPKKRRERKKKKKKRGDDENSNINDSIKYFVADILGRGEILHHLEDNVEEEPPPSLAIDRVIGSGDAPVCSICLEPYAAGDRVARMKQYNDSRPCSQHWFKEDCITEWLQTHNDCPMSRIRMIYYPSEEDSADTV